MRTNFPARRNASEISPLEAEVMSEQAAALAQSGRRVEVALAALADEHGADRPQRLKAAADAVYGFFIQREIIGMRDHRGMIEHYGIPREVLARLGAS